MANIQQLNGPSDLLPLVSSFADLSAGTEFSSYKQPQWRLLLSGEEISAFVMHSEKSEDATKNKYIGTTCQPCFDGCVLRVQLKDDTVGFGMVLVRPTKRGTGIAKALLKEAMKLDTEQCNTRFVLAVCSTLGQPLYRKLGFRDVGTVTAMTSLVSDWMQQTTTNEKYSNNYYSLTFVDGKECTQDQLNKIADCDTHANGIDRKKRLRVILHGYAEGSRSTVATLSSEENKDYATATAVARQDCADGPLIIGPIQGREEFCIPLIQALIENHFKNESMEDLNVVMIMVVDHPDLVDALLKLRGMTKLWECPSMSSDGRPVYESGDGSYLAMMHPTLG